MTYDDFDEEWVDDDESEDTDDLLLCPSCGADVHEDSQQCPRCGDWIVPVYSANRWTKLVWLIAASLVIVSLLLITIR